MENISGIIEKKDRKTGHGDKGDWVRIAYTIGGKHYSTFNQDYDVFKEGEKVDIEFEKNGVYNNIKTMILLGEMIKIGEKPTGKLSDFKQSAEVEKEYVDTQRLIIRQNSVSQANEFIKTCYDKFLTELTKQEATKELLKLAEQIEEWIMRS